MHSESPTQTRQYNPCETLVHRVQDDEDTDMDTDNRPNHAKNALRLSSSAQRLNVGLMSSHSFEQCRQSLIRAIRGTTDIEFQQLSCALTCVLTARRSLALAELEDALGLWATIAPWGSAVGSRQLASRKRPACLRTFDIIFEVDAHDRVSFQIPGMVSFLQRCRIKGLDSSHRTLATLCNEQNKLDSVDLKFEAEADGWELLDHNSGVFSGYAKKYCHYHLSLAQRTSLMHYLQVNPRLGWTMCQNPIAPMHNTEQRASDTEAVYDAFQNLKV